MTDEIESERILEQLHVLRAQTGDADAFCQLFRRHNDNLLYYLRRLLNSSTEAEDTLQEVWLTVIRKISSLNDSAAFRMWVYRIARNHAISRLRKKQKLAELNLTDETYLPNEPETVDESFVFQHDAASVHQALSELSTRHREVLTLRFLEQLSYDEIGEIAGCSVGTIRSRIHYAKARLREILVQRKEAK